MAEIKAKRYRIWLNKQDDFKYLSHHDIAWMLEQAIRRADLPIAMAGKYNPRAKISFYSSVPVGVASEGEPVEIVLTEEIKVDRIGMLLQGALPKGLLIYDITLLANKSKHDLQICYSIEIPSLLLSQQKIDDLNSLTSLIVTRSRKKGQKQFDIRPFICDCCAKVCGDVANIHLTVLMTSKGSVSPWEVLAFLNIPKDDTTSIAITRTSVKFLPLTL